MRSWIGRNFAAIRLNEELAQTLGINTFRYKMLAFTISNLSRPPSPEHCSASTANYIEPSQLSITQSLDAIAMVLLGGMGSILGPVVGAFLLTGLPHVIEFSAELAAATYGAILILVILRDAARHRRDCSRVGAMFLEVDALSQTLRRPRGSIRGLA